MRKINGEPVQDDIDHIERVTGKTVVEAEPSPQKDSRIKPHVTRVTTDDGKTHDVFHAKPIYYADKTDKWRPMSEIADEHGNHYIKLKAGWQSKMSGKYLRWLHKRMDLINQGKPDDLPIEKDEDGNVIRTVPKGLSGKVGQAHVRIPDQALENMWRNPNF